MGDPDRPELQQGSELHWYDPREDDFSKLHALLQRDDAKALPMHEEW